jgi:esterase
LQQLREALDRVGFKAIDYFSERAFEDEHGWGFRFDIVGMTISTRTMAGMWWEDWPASSCPILLVHGKKSWALKLEEAERMETRRPHTKLEVFETCGHSVHTDDLNGFYKVVKNFFDRLNFT